MCNFLVSGPVRNRERNAPLLCPAGQDTVPVTRGRTSTAGNAPLIKYRGGVLDRLRRASYYHWQIDFHQDRVPFVSDVGQAGERVAHQVGDCGGGRNGQAQGATARARGDDDGVHSTRAAEAGD